MSDIFKDSYVELVEYSYDDRDGTIVSLCKLPPEDGNITICGFGKTKEDSLKDLINSFYESVRFSNESNHEWWHDMYVEGHYASKQLTRKTLQAVKKLTCYCTVYENIVQDKDNIEHVVFSIYWNRNNDKNQKHGFEITDSIKLDDAIKLIEICSRGFSVDSNLDSFEFIGPTRYTVKLSQTNVTYGSGIGRSLQEAICRAIIDMARERKRVSDIKFSTLEDLKGI